MFGFFRKKESKSDIEDKVASLSKDDTTLLSYQEKAQEQLSYLIDFMNEHGDGNNEYGEKLFQYAVKAKFKEEDQTEHMWVQVHEFKEEYFIGKLANKPSTIKHINYGDDVTVLREDVEDWILQDLLTKTKVGGFSSGYIRNNAKQE